LFPKFEQALECAKGRLPRGRRSNVVEMSTPSRALLLEAGSSPAGNGGGSFRRQAQGGESREEITLHRYFKPATAKDSNRSHDVQEFAAAKSESEIGAVANSESQASGAVTVEQNTGQEEKESIFKSSIVCRFFQITAEARAMDRVTKSVFAQQETHTPQPLGIRMLMKRLKYANLSDEDARKMAREYIDQRIYAANVKTCGARTLGDREMCSMMAVMKWYPLHMAPWQHRAYARGSTKHT